MKTINKNKIKYSMRGIVMVEALMSIAIMMIAVMAPLTLSSQSAKYAKYTLNKITASYLAEQQIEMMVNFKKSFDIYCFNNSTSCNQDTLGFNEFVKNVTDSSNEYNGTYCPTYSGAGGVYNNTPCFFDESSFAYKDNTGTIQKPEIKNKALTDCKYLFELPDDIMSCTNNAANTGTGTSFTRKMFIDNVDYLVEADGANNINNAIKLTSWVCINSSCDPGDTKAVTLVYFIYK
jgi:hypothetical protein